jgi:oxygen-dependent protoporphyrinogen oxidase
MGDDVVERILLPVVAGVHAADPDLVEADAVIPGILAALRTEGSLAAAAARLRAASGVPGSAIAGLSGGMTTLVDALTRAVREAGVDIRLGTGVSAVEPGPPWRLHTSAGVVEADDLVVAIDAPAAAALLSHIPDVAEPLSRVRVGDVAVVAAVVLARELDADPVGSGVLVAPGHPRVRAKALTHATAKWEWIRSAFGPGRHLVRLSYGRDGRIDESLDDLPGMVRADVGHIFGLHEPRVADLRIVRWDRSLVHPVVGHRDTVSAIRAAVEASPTLALAGAGLGGNGLAGTIAQSMTVAAQLPRP